jgi:hypothetical protein
MWKSCQCKARSRSIADEAQRRKILSQHLQDKQDEGRHTEPSPAVRGDKKLRLEQRLAKN